MNRAFTLIELLVVVTIIVVLLALLVPAMDQAIYQAELATCGTRLRGIGGGANMYAASNRRYYPHRPETRMPQAPSAEWLSLPANLRRPSFDLRPMIEPYIPLDMLTDPLAKHVDLSGEDSDVLNISTYSFYAGWQFFTYGTGMLRLGDAYTFDNGVSGPWRFTVIAGDHEAVNTNVPHIESSHPDRGSVLTNQVVQEGPDYVSGALLGAGVLKVTVSRWTTAAGNRGPSDYNFAYADESVARVTDVSFPDSRLRQVPYSADAGSPAVMTWLWRSIPDR